MAAVALSAWPKGTARSAFALAIACSLLRVKNLAALSKTPRKKNHSPISHLSLSSLSSLSLSTLGMAEAAQSIELTEHKPHRHLQLDLRAAAGPLMTNLSVGGLSGYVSRS
jgi:hypothetical protein